MTRVGHFLFVTLAAMISVAFLWSTADAIAGSAIQSPFTLPNVGTPGTYGDSTHYPIITTDPQGRVSGVTIQTVNGAISYPATDANTLALWKLDETSGTTFSNSISPGTFDLTGSGAYTEGVIGLYVNAVRFTGGTAPIHLAGASTLEPASVSASVWIRPWVFTLSWVVGKLYHSDSAHTAPFGTLYANTTASGTITLTATTGATESSATSAIPVLGLGAWHLLVMTFDGNSHVATLYVDAVSVATVSLSGALDYGTHGPWTIGDPFSVNSVLKADVDDARVWNVALTAAQVAIIYRSGTGYLSQ